MNRRVRGREMYVMRVGCMDGWIGWIGLDWNWIGLDLIGLDWIGLDCMHACMDG